MPKLPVVKTRELIRVLEKLGFYHFHQVGSHAQFKNVAGVKVTVAIHGGRELGKKTVKGILDDITVSVEEFIELLRK
ncbi:MAG: hypothetical protein UY50_C0022G0002 [Parcubacteria group bacterium GW2011_GWA2_49_9]|nr:MAG: hypothetical protein UY50_C0022G0002 [Parcubacteria group bacterium GW2011_GWA2_49_9]